MKIFLFRSLNMSARSVCLLGLGLGLVLGQDLSNSTGSLSLPNPRDCANR